MADIEFTEAEIHPTRPKFRQRFRPAQVREIVQTILNEKLEGQEYQQENTPAWTREIADEIKTQLKNRFDRYKIAVQVVIGETRGQGARMGFRALWDPATDTHAEVRFINESIFCVATVFGVYLY
eukprot:gnl/Trimastix_PCT/1211.p1 GENE.gnl/Trimastix_PCT/1211~~gnl/Trimastix_PCT/1211.p1  ORF type:complete len:125 (-),score=2.45 gnl/Trimastix_PCT/1211:48-422(-)